MANPDERACYCGLWETKPEALREQGVPDGFCGMCQNCGQPGHTRHYPGSVPYTGAWCDACFAKLARRSRLRIPVLMAIGLVVLGMTASLVLTTR